MVSTRRNPEAQAEQQRDDPLQGAVDVLELYSDLCRQKDDEGLVRDLIRRNSK